MSTESSPKPAKKRAPAAKKQPAVTEETPAAIAIEAVAASAPKAKATKAKAPARKVVAKKAVAKKTVVKKVTKKAENPDDTGPEIKEPPVEEPGIEDPDEPTLPEQEPPADEPEDEEPAIKEPPPEELSASAAKPKKSAKKAAKKKPAIAAETTEEPAEVAGPEPKLERLQKILARAGISSRRKAEELILGGLVQVNGKIVTELGTKADMARDHVRVDGKLLQGPERIRYFVLNKPKGYVTTVSDPEGRPTVMQFFEKERERLYPVGRLDYLSEGLLLVTNDGELANKLTKASSGVEKTYLVKVAGQPSEDMLDALRNGVVIEKGRPGDNAGRVRTAPAQIRQVRQGDNPWYEVIIIEGRNRELRKMFEEIGHHVEKIRRIGYGPLILDQEPGKLRELEPEEVHSLHLAAEGKLKTRRRRGPVPAQLPREAGKTVRFKKADGRPGYVKPNRSGPGELKLPPYVPYPVAPRPAEARTFEPRASEPRSTDRRPPAARTDARPARTNFSRPEGAPPAFSKPRFSKPGFEKPAFDKPRFDKPDFEKPSSDSPSFDRSASKPPFSKPAFSKPGFSKPGFKKPGRAPEPPVTEYILPPRKHRPELDDDDAKPAFNPDFKPGFRTKPSAPPPASEDAPRKSSRISVEPVPDRGPEKASGARFDRPRPSSGAPYKSDARPSRPRTDGPPAASKPFRQYPGGPPIVDGERPAGRPAARSFDRPASGPGGKPFRPKAGGFSDRPSNPRSSSDRPSSPRPPRFNDGAKPFRPRTDRSAAGDRPFRPASDRPATGRPFTPRPGASRPFSDSSSNGRPSGPSRPRTGDFRPSRPSGPNKGFRSDTPRPAPGGSNSKPSNRLGPDGQPRIKVRARDSFTGKNKGRPKPKSKSDE